MLISMNQLSSAPVGGSVVGNTSSRFGLSLSLLSMMKLESRVAAAVAVAFARVVVAADDVDARVVVVALAVTSLIGRSPTKSIRCIHGAAQASNEWPRV